MKPQDMTWPGTRKASSPCARSNTGWTSSTGNGRPASSVCWEEIRDNLDGLTDAVLAATLRDMVNDQIVDRRQYKEIPPRVEYSLSEKGASAHKILRSICCWAVRYCPLPEESLPPCKKVGGCPL